MYLNLVSGILIMSGLLTLLFISWDSWILMSSALASVIPSHFFEEFTSVPYDARVSERAVDDPAASKFVDSERSDDSDCDLYHGQWYYDDTATALYTNSTCPILIQGQNCQANGRPDKEYENWRWRPAHCELSRFNATYFLELMSGKTLAFVGDSLARNQFESLVCSLWQVEVPENQANSKMQRWYFRSYSVTIIRIWSSWLLHNTKEPFSYVSEDVPKVHLDIPDESFMQLLSSFDVVLLNSGHWFVKPSVYVKANQIVGTQLCSLPAEEHHQTNVSNFEALRISTETVLSAMVTHPNYSGLTIVVSYTPDHYESGAWNTGGSCKGKVRPLMPGQLVRNNYTSTMHEKQLIGFYQAIKNQTNKSRLKLMDITEAFSYRHDGHPGPYRSTNPFKITKRRRHRKRQPQDCLHWCMPGAVDIWNEITLEIIRRDFVSQRVSDSLTVTNVIC